MSSRATTAGTAGRLTLVNLAITGCALVSAPVLARALGPGGRGDLAAILVPLGLAPFVAELGLGVYAARAAARGRDVAVVLGTLGALLVALSALGPLLAFPIAQLLANGRDTVETWLVIGFCLLPVSLLANLLAGICLGLQRWRAVIAMRLIPPVGTVALLVPLYVTDTLTVGSAAAATTAASVVSLVPVLPVLVGYGRPRWSGYLARRGLPFGAKAWVTGIALSANVRLDQLVMIRLVEPRVLGLYAVAVTLATMPSVLIRGMNGALFPRIAAGDGALTAKALRITLLLVGVTSLALAVICKPLLTVLLGEAFADATPLVLILLVGGLMRAGAETLESSITADGAPGATAVAQALALIVTVPGLVLLVPTLGGEGAALVSVAAYGVTFAYLLAVAYRRFDGGLREFLLATPADFKLLLRTGRSAWSRARHIWPRPTAA